MCLLLGIASYANADDSSAYRLSFLGGSSWEQLSTAYEYNFNNEFQTYVELAALLGLPNDLNNNNVYSFGVGARKFFDFDKIQPFLGAGAAIAYSENSCLSQPAFGSCPQSGDLQSNYFTILYPEAGMRFRASDKTYIDLTTRYIMPYRVDANSAFELGVEFSIQF